jgi:hypothetical protein
MPSRPDDVWIAVDVEIGVDYAAGGQRGAEGDQDRET